MSNYLQLALRAKADGCNRTCPKTDDLTALVAEANKMFPPGMILTAADWQRLDLLERDPDAYLTELSRIITTRTASDGNGQQAEPNEPWWEIAIRHHRETTGRSLIATTPAVLADDDQRI
jgi:hypothetical protein